MRLRLRLPSTDSRACYGCGEPVLDELAVHVWMDTALGVFCAWTHPGVCEEQAVLNQSEQPAKRRSEPKTREAKLEERMEREREATQG